MELEIVRKDGSRLPVILNASAIEDEAGHFLRSRSTIFDITERKQAERKIADALRKEAVLRREVHHRVKNNLQVISSLLYLQSTKINDPAILEVLRESRSRARSIALTHELLFQGENLDKIELADYAQRLATDLFVAYRTPPGLISFHIHGGGIFLGLDAAIPCGLIITELISNALKHAFPNGRRGEIHVHLASNAQQGFSLRISDDGIGLPAGFDLANAATMGLQLVRDLTGQLGGILSFHPRDPGSSVEIAFPKPEAEMTNDE
jgi:two-component sensor histidine kinase